MYFTTTLQKIFKDKLAPDNSLVLKEKDNVTPGMDKYQVQCLPCSSMKKPKLMNTGNKSKALSNVKAHLKNPSHVNHVSDYLSGKNKETQVERERKHAELIKERFDFIDERYPGNYEMMQLTSAKNEIRCKSCNQLISLEPERGSFSFNVEEHSRSCNTTVKKQSSLENFFIPSKKAKTSL